MARSAAEDARCVRRTSSFPRYPTSSVSRSSRARLDAHSHGAAGHRQESIARALRVIDCNAMAQAAMIGDILDGRVSSPASCGWKSGRPTCCRWSSPPSRDHAVGDGQADRHHHEARPEYATRAWRRRPPSADRVESSLERGQVHRLGWSVEIPAPAGASARLSVTDSGLGITPEFLPFVFDRFRQSDASSTRRQGGLGLGLALARDLVELHGGTIRAASAGAHQGATFTISLPTGVSTEGLAGPTSATDSSAADGVLLKGIRALVVDDDTDARELLAAVLVSYGAAVVAARSSDEALGLLQEAASGHPFDVILSDIGMPRDDGYELMRRAGSWIGSRWRYCRWRSLDRAPTTAIARWRRLSSARAEANRSKSPRISHRRHRASTPAEARVTSNHNSRLIHRPHQLN